MNPYAFYGILISSVVFSSFLSSAITLFTDGKLSIGLIFYFIFVFPLFWKWGKATYPVQEGDIWNSDIRKFVISALAFNVFLIVCQATLLNPKLSFSETRTTQPNQPSTSAINENQRNEPVSDFSDL